MSSKLKFASPEIRVGLDAADKAPAPAKPKKAPKAKMPKDKKVIIPAKPKKIKKK